MQHVKHTRIDAVLLGSIVALGASLRLWGVGFGLPLVSNFYVRPDESLIVQAALPFFERRGDPQFYAYPALMVELCATIFAAFGSWFGDFASNPSAYFLSARLVSVCAGTATILLVYGMACQLCERRWAIAAAALYAVAPLPVRDAHFGVTDTLMTFFVAAALWIAVSHAKDGNGQYARSLPLAATLFALALSTKYTAALAAPALVACALERYRFREPMRLLWRLVPAGLLAAGVFVLLNPYALLRRGESAGTLLGMFNVFYGGAEAQPESAWSVGGAMMQVLRPLEFGPGGWVTLVLGIAALGWLWRTERTPGLLTIACGTIPFLIALLPFRHPLPFRYVLPALPGLLVLAVYAASRISERWQLTPAAVLTGGALFLWQLAMSAALVTTLARDDTRSVAGNWIVRHVPVGVPVVMLGAPEAEPQIVESATSIERRIAYVHRIYGSHSGNVVSALYRLLLPTAGEGHEVYRNVGPQDLPGSQCAVVLTAYPLRLVGEQSLELGASYGVVRERAEFNPMTAEMDGAVLDRSDAFFLPMNPVGRVLRPGPRITVLLIDRAPATTD